MALTSIRRVLFASLLCGCVVQIIQAAPFDNWGNHVLADLGWLFDIEETTTPQPTRHEHLTYVLLVIVFDVNSTQLFTR